MKGHIIILQINTNFETYLKSKGNIEQITSGGSVGYRYSYVDQECGCTQVFCSKFSTRR